jgi:hypothetical protein
VTPRQPVATLLRQPHRGQRLRAAHEGKVQLAALHRRRRAVDQLLGRRAADPGVDAVARGCAEFVGKARRRVVVRPALAIDHLKRVEFPQNVTHAGDVGRLARPLRPAEQGLRRVAVAHGVLGGSDDAEPTVPHLRPTGRTR